MEPEDGSRIIMATVVFLFHRRLPSNGWKQINGAGITFNTSGYRQTGWVRVDRQWYYLNGDSVMTSGWQFVKWCMVLPEWQRRMQTGWQSVRQ